MGKCYLCVNPAWPEWTKIGITSNVKKRLNGYQTGTPFNDYEFKTLIQFKYSDILEDCVQIHFNGVSEPKEWMNKPHDIVLPVFMDYKQKIEKNPEEWRKWVESKKEEVEGDTYKYIKYGKKHQGSKWKFKFTNSEGLELLINNKELNVNVDDIDITKSYTSRELAELLKVYDSEGNPYQAIVTSWGKPTRSKYDWKNNLPNGMSNIYGIERISI